MIVFVKSVMISNNGYVDSNGGKCGKVVIVKEWVYIWLVK